MWGLCELEKKKEFYYVVVGGVRSFILRSYFLGGVGWLGKKRGDIPFLPLVLFLHNMVT
jgi:hypothetical protein